mmetsp:Transcript_19711/g.55676  ORF Transcript_19711/g.55676 Transcript_19711/m.55676 type:complete len:207 (-) Transcript_19711:692-1312(-)
MLTPMLMRCQAMRLRSSPSSPSSTTSSGLSLRRSTISCRRFLSCGSSIGSRSSTPTGLPRQCSRCRCISSSLGSQHRRQWLNRQPHHNNSKGSLCPLRLPPPQRGGDRRLPPMITTTAEMRPITSRPAIGTSISTTPTPSSCSSSTRTIGWAPSSASPRSPRRSRSSASKDARPSMWPAITMPPCTWSALSCAPIPRPLAWSAPPT